MPVGSLNWGFLQIVLDRQAPQKGSCPSETAYVLSPNPETLDSDSSYIS